MVEKEEINDFIKNWFQVYLSIQNTIVFFIFNCFIKKILKGKNIILLHIFIIHIFIIHIFIIDK